VNKRIFILLLFILVINTNQLFARDYERIQFMGSRIESSNKNKSHKKVDRESGETKILSSRLERLYKLHAENKEYTQFARQSDLKLIEDRVVVTILSRSGITTANIDENNLKDFGGKIQAKAKHSMRVEIPISELENVANAIKEFAEIIPPMKPKEHAVTSEGVALMNGDHWQTAGYDGSGLKVAVIDGGFDSLTEAQNSGDMPSSYIGQDFAGGGLQTGSVHGTAVAEAIFDLVPQAEFYLYKISDGTDLENAKDSCISKEVDIVNHSMGWFNAGGYYDGTGFICGVTDNAINNGILWVNSSGNSAEDHYRSTFTNDGSGYHDFSGTGANINPIGPDPTHVWLHDPGETIIITLNWNDYPYSDQDYDLYLLRYNDSWVLIDSSTDRQTGVFTRPEETIVFTNPYDKGMYGVLVKEYSTTSDWDFTFFNLDKSFGYRTNSSSLTDPGTITDVVTVGAINRLNYASGPQETFSSQGPTTDGRIKPDVAAPDNCISHTYGYWYGTSLSSPHTAGVCALIKSRFPGYSNSDIRNFLYTECATDLGATGKDNIYGWGKIEMPDITLTVTSPNGGEDFQVDSIHNVTWTSSGTSGGVRIEYSINNGESWSDVIASMPNTGVYSWTIPDDPSDSCLLRVTDTIGSPSDTCDTLFTISPIPNITVISPNGGENFQVDSIHNVTWTSTGTSGGVRVQYSTDNGENWSDVIASMPDTGVFSWTIPDAPSDSCLLRIADTNESLADTCDSLFTISPIPFITVSSPNGGEDFQVNSIHEVTWTSSGTSGGIIIQYSTDDGENWSDVIASMPDTGVFSWTIPDAPSDSCLLRITDTIGSPSDTCDSLFTISPIPFITVSSPNGGEDFQVDSVHDVSWTSSGTSGEVRVQYSTDNGDNWSDVIASMPDTGVYSWTIPDSPSDSCLLRIADTNGSLTDTCDTLFMISPIPNITVVAPNGGEDWGIGYSNNITWTSIGSSGGVRIEYSTDNGENWLDVIASMPDTGVYSWSIPDVLSDSCLVKISDTNGNPADTSDSLFSIVSVTSIPTPKLPEVYSFNIKGITVSNQFEIKYALPEKAKVTLELYDIKGTKIKALSEEKPAGYYSKKIDMRGNPAGVYFIRIEANEKKFTQINKVVLLVR